MWKEYVERVSESPDDSPKYRAFIKLHRIAQRVNLLPHVSRADRRKLCLLAYFSTVPIMEPVMMAHLMHDRTHVLSQLCAYARAETVVPVATDTDWEEWMESM
jgi:hypothetical protein